MTYANGITLNGSSGFTNSSLAPGESISSVTLTTNATVSSSNNYNAGPWDIVASDPTGPGFDPANYAITYNDGTLTVAPASLTVSNLGAYGKTYDGTTTATLNIAAATLAVVQPDDDVSLSPSGYTATFAQANVGTAIPVTISGLSLSGADAEDYTLTSPPSPSANIDQAPLTITATNVSMTYADGTTLNGSRDFTADGLAPGDSVTSVVLTTNATLSSSNHYNAGPWDIVASDPTGPGFDPANYDITYDDGTLTVAPASLTVSNLAPTAKPMTAPRRRR